MRTGGVEPPQRVATGLQPAEHADARRPREKQKGDRPDSNRYREDHDLGCCRYTTATMKRGRPDSNRRLLADNRVLLPLSYIREVGKAGPLLPQPGAETSASTRLPSTGCLSIDTPCQRVSAPPPPHRSALEAYRGQLHVRAHALHSPCSVTSRPARRQTVLPKWRGWDSNPRSRAHEAREDNRSSTALRIWPAGFEPAVSGSRNRRSGRLSYSQMQYGRRQQDANLRTTSLYATTTRRLAARPRLQTEAEAVEAGRPTRLRRDTAPMAVLPVMGEAGIEPATSCV